MTEGLITRIGRWIDTQWEPKATESMVLQKLDELAARWLLETAELRNNINGLRKELDEVFILTNSHESAKELADLKTRLEKIELYSGMTRKVDPLKPPVVKSAFSM